MTDSSSEEPVPDDGKSGSYTINSRIDIGQVAEGAVITGVAIGNVYGDVHLHGTTQLEIPPPPAAPPLPQVTHFVGRETELADYLQQLAERHWIVVSGMPGIGKTAFAAQVVARATSLDNVCWHACHENESIQTIIWDLAAFLARHEQPEVWRMLQGARLNGGQLPPTETLLDYLLEQLSSGQYTVCFDDWQFVKNDPLSEPCLLRLRDLSLRGRLQLVVISQRTPDFAAVESLGGLNAADTRQFVSTQQVTLTPEVVDQLHAYTGGNAQLLTLALEVLRRAPDPRLAVTQLAHAVNIERYLLKQIDQLLDEDERSVMQAIAVLRGEAGTRECLEAMVGERAIYQALSDLSERHLLISMERDQTREYQQHAIVRDFYYGTLSRGQRQTFHQRAARYSAEAQEWFRAVQHFTRAGDQKPAAAIVAERSWTLINEGHLRSFDDLLAQFEKSQLEPELWVRVKIAQGQVKSVRGETVAARGFYQEALTDLAGMPVTPPVRELTARTCRGMGELLEYQSPQEALDWLQRGLAELPQDGRQEESAFRVHMGTIYMNLGNYAEALSALERALELLPAGPSQMRSMALMNLGATHFNQGHVQRATEYALQGLEISRQLHDHFQSASILSNLGAYKFVTSDWKGAIADFQAALTLAERLGSEMIKVASAVNLGIAFTYLGDDQAALQYLTNGLDSARKSHLSLYEGIAKFHLSDLYIKRGELEVAQLWLNEAEDLAMESGSQANLPEIYGARAEIALAQGRYQAAVDYALQSVNLAQELGESTELGISLRILGQAEFSIGRPQEAAVEFEKSLSLLDGNDLYETARTKLQWGIVLFSSAERDRGQAQIRDAQAIFETLEAKRDLKMAAEILGNA